MWDKSTIFMQICDALQISTLAIANVHAVFMCLLPFD